MGLLVRRNPETSSEDVYGRMKSLGRVIELSGQTVEVARLQPGSVIVRHDATSRSVRGGAARFSMEGDKVDR